MVRCSMSFALLHWLIMFYYGESRVLHRSNLGHNAAHKISYLYRAGDISWARAPLKKQLFLHMAGGLIRRAMQLVKDATELVEHETRHKRS